MMDYYKILADISMMPENVCLNNSTTVLDVLNLLKELKANQKEARLLTLSEVVEMATSRWNGSHWDGALWADAPRGKSGANIGDVDIGWCQPVTVGNSLVLLNFGDTDGDPSLSKYGITWRCWSYKPTKEQLEANKWPERKEKDE